MATPLGQVPDPPSVDSLIEQCGDKILAAMNEEENEGSNQDRIYILRTIRKSDLYWRNLQNYAPEFYAGILDATSVFTANVSGGDNGEDTGYYDYSQNIFRGYGRKLEAVLGNRMPNAIAVPNVAGDADAISAIESANNAALYIKNKCDLQLQSLYLVHGLYNFGTNFWHVDWEIDGEKNGYKQVISQDGTEQTPLGDASFICPGCTQAHAAEGENPTPPETCEGCGEPMDQSSFHPPTQVDTPKTKVEQIPNGALSISLHNASEVTVPLRASCIDTCDWLDYSREVHKGSILQKYRQPDGTNPLRAKLKDLTSTDMTSTSSAQYAENVRSAFASPIGLVRTKTANWWTVRDLWWTPAMYETVDDQQVRDSLLQNFPTGVRITMVKGKIVDLKEEKLQDHWQECKPEPGTKIMVDPLGADWFETQDLVNNSINQRNEIIERSNDPGFCDVSRVDMDSWQTRRDTPTEMIPAIPRAGGSLSDIIYRPESVKFSDQIAPFIQELVTRSESTTGLLPDIWGGGGDEPTARQAELKKNAALMQLSVIWTMIGKSLEGLYTKACRLLGSREDGVLAFSKKNQFQEYDNLSIVMEDLRSENFHYQADEAVPMSWGQERDLIMWMLDKPAELLQLWGLSDPMNIFEFKQLMGMPGERVPLLANLKKAMGVVKQLLEDGIEGKGPVPGPPDPQTGQPGAQQSSVQPDWEDDFAFSSSVIKAFLQENPKIKITNPQGYQNSVLYGQACDAKANVPAPAPPPKTSVAVSVKPGDIGNSGTQDLLEKAGLVDKGTPVNAVSPPPKPAPIPSTQAQILAEQGDAKQKNIMPPPQIPPAVGPVQ